MKTINASFRPEINHYDDRLFFRGSPWRAEITRRARRHERRAAKAFLRVDLHTNVEEGVAAYKLQVQEQNATPAVTAAPVVAAPATRHQVAKVTVHTATIINFPVVEREVMVVRKRAFHRATVETLRIAA